MFVSSSFNTYVNLPKKRLRGFILILLVRESIFVGWGFSFPIMFLLWFKLFLCHTPIKPDLHGFPRIGVFAWPRDHEVYIIWYRACIFIFTFRVDFSLCCLCFGSNLASNQFGQIVFFLCYSWFVALNWVLWNKQRVSYYSFFLNFLFRVKKHKQKTKGERGLFCFFLRPVIKPYCNCLKIDISVI